MNSAFDSRTAAAAVAEPAVGTSRAEKNGVVYTKAWVVELILDLAGYVPQSNLVDMVAVEPAAGEGSFVREMVRRLIASCRRQGRPLSDCAPSLLAYELDPSSAERLHRAIVQSIQEQVLDHTEHLQVQRLAQAWVHTGDYLLEAPKLPRVDFVVGNPPYIRLEGMDEATAATYRCVYRTMVGRADLYVAFFEAALKQLKPQGVCAFICADRWMLNQYGAELRRLITSGYAVETIIEMHRSDAFELEVSAYPAITVIRRERQQHAVVASAGMAVEAHGAARIAHSLRATRTAEPSSEPPLQGLRAMRVESWFEGDAPWPCVSPERLALLKHLEAEFYPLESVGTGTKVGIGVATGADEVFITTDAALVEPERLLPLAMAYDLIDGQLRWSGRYLVNPWSGRGLVDLERSPRLKAYFEEHRERLQGRHVGKRNPQGWYRTIDRVDHGLTGRPKLYIADIKDRLEPILDRGQTYPHHNLYFVESYSWDLEVLGGLLLSEIAQFFVECYGVRMRGGYLRFQAQYLRRIRIPRPQDVTPTQEAQLIEAFRRRDRELATEVALDLYGIDHLPGREV